MIFNFDTLSSYPDDSDVIIIYDNFYSPITSCKANKAKPVHILKFSQCGIENDSIGAPTTSNRYFTDDTDYIDLYYGFRAPHARRLIEELKTHIETLARKHNFFFESKMPFPYKVTVYTNPLLLTLIGEEDYRLDILHGEYLRKSPSLHPAFKERTIADAVRKWCKYSSPKMIKTIATLLCKNETYGIEVPAFNLLIPPLRLPTTSVSFGHNIYRFNKKIDLMLFDVVDIVSNIFPIDYVYKFLDFYNPEAHERLILWLRQMNLERVIFFFKQFSFKTAYKILTDACNDQPFILIDSINQSFKLNSIPKNWKTNIELHNKISKMYNEKEAEKKNVPLKTDEMILPLDGVNVTDEVKIVLPKTGKDLVLWGQELKNCLASYIDRVNNKSCSIIGVVVKDKLKYALEINSHPILYNMRLDDNNKAPYVPIYTINQFKGYSNCDPEDNNDELLKNEVTKCIDKYVKLG